jgi:hypothetical protein
MYTYPHRNILLHNLTSALVSRASDAVSVGVGVDVGAGVGVRHLCSQAAAGGTRDEWIDYIKAYKQWWPRCS